MEITRTHDHPIFITNMWIRQSLCKQTAAYIFLYIISYVEIMTLDPSRKIPDIILSNYTCFK